LILSLKKEIKDYAYAIGIDIIGFTNAAPLLEVQEILFERQKKGLVSAFESDDLEMRTNPLKLFPQAKSIIVIGVSYYFDEIPKNENGMLAGKIARYARVKDYHKVLKEKMSKIMEFIKNKLSYMPQHRFLVDTSPLVERAIARRAGIGWLGQNAAIINKVYGTYIVLGEIITDLELQPDPPDMNECYKCKKCLEVCPAGALSAPYTVNPKRCLSYWTQAKDDIPREIRPLLANRIVGCDTCQEICPHNKDIEKAKETNFTKFEDLRTPDLLGILKMSNKKFKELFGQTAASWCGKRVLQRNALVALGNSGNREMVDEIIPYLSDERPQIRLHAAWALGQLGGEKAFEALKNSLQKEADYKVRKEIEDSLKNYPAYHKNLPGKQN
jgi:epoxyqueuosine reductase